MRVCTLLVLLFAELAGCGRPPEAPRELNELSVWLYREWDNEDPEVMTVGLQNLQDFLKDIDLEASLLDRSWELKPITSDDVSDIDRPKGVDPRDALGVSVTGLSKWKVAEHAQLQMERDQMPAEPTADEYNRRFPDVDSSSCFLDESCDPIASENDVVRRNALMSVEFVLYKDFRWIDTDDGNALAARSWLDRSWEGEKGSTEVVQSYSVDIWMPVGKQIWRYQTLWSESKIPGATEGVTLGVLKKSIGDIFEAGDEAIGELYH